MSDDVSAIYQSALGLLARREHSAQELRQKLSQRFALQVESIAVVIARLQQEGYQSDSRFVEVYVQSRMRKGFGSVRIQQELAIKGVSKADVIQQFSEQDAEQAENNILAMWQKKFGRLPQSAEEKHKQKQFLLYRGFPSGEIAQLFRQLQATD